MSTIFSTAPALLLYFVFIALLSLLSCITKKEKGVVTVCYVLVHIAAVYSFVKRGASLDELLILFLFSILVSLIIGDHYRKKHLSAEQAENHNTEDKAE